MKAVCSCDGFYSLHTLQSFSSVHVLLVLVVWAVIRENILRKLSLLELILIESTVTLHIACCKTSQKCKPSLLSLTFPGSAREGAKGLMGVHFSQIQHRNVS